MIETKEIINGNLNNRIIYICDLRYNDYSNKPIRNIKPTRVLVRDNKETNKTIYYSNSHFVKLNRKDQPTKTIISLFDNTGYRSNTGIAVNCFYTEEECISFYKKQVKEVIEGLIEYKKSLCKNIDQKINEYEEILFN